MSESYTFFCEPFGPTAWMSSFNCKYSITYQHPTVHEDPDTKAVTITYEEIFFPTAEHMVMWLKAMRYKDFATAAKVLTLATPKEAKGVSRDIQGFSEADWVGHEVEGADGKKTWVEGARMGIMLQVVLAKLESNPELKELLLATGDSIIAEMEPEDEIWGTGWGEDHPLARTGTWPGKNLMGLVWTKARDILKRSLKN